MAELPSSSVENQPAADDESPVVDNNRNETFKKLLACISRRMTKDDATQLAFLKECTIPESPSNLDVLQGLRKAGYFSQRSCFHLETLLREINRCDLADLVLDFRKTYPDQPPEKSRHASMQENTRSHYPVSPIKRSATDPPDVFNRRTNPILHNQTFEYSETSKVCQEETVGGGRSELSISTSGSEATLPVTSTPHKSSKNAHKDEFMEMETPIAAVQHHTSYAYSSAEQVPHKLSFSSLGSQLESSSFNSPSLPGLSQTTTLDNLNHSAASNYQQNVNEIVKKMAYSMAVSMIEQASSQEVPTSNEWYKSTSSVSAASAPVTDSESHSVYSDSEGGLRNQRKYQDTPSNVSSHSPKRRRKQTSLHMPRSPPAHYVQSSSENEAIDDEFESLSDIQSGEESRPQDNRLKQLSPEVTLRHKKRKVVRRHSTISDATPRQSLTETKRFSCNISESSLKRQSVVSDATSVTTLTKSYDMTREGSQTEGSTEDFLKPAVLFRKEKPSFWRKLAILRNKARLTPSFVWKVPREDLIKPVWHHKVHALITHKQELDTNNGKYNPKLIFQLYPYGLYQDEGDAVTMAVRISTPEKCPPLPLSSQISVKLVVWDGDGKDKQELKRFHPVTKDLSTTSVFYIYNVVTHDLLKRSKCKYFFLEVAVNCSGL